MPFGQSCLQNVAIKQQQELEQIDMAMLETAFRYAKRVWDFVDNLVDEKNKEIAKYQAKYRDYSRDEYSAVPGL